MPNTNTQQLPFVFTMKDGNKFTGYGESREDVLTRHIITGTRRAGHQLSREEADDPNNRYVLFDSATFEHYLGEKFDKIAEDAYHVAFPPKQPVIFRFTMNSNTEATFQGESEKEVLMGHLIKKTKKAGHQISFEEAKDSRILAMIDPREYIRVFGKFDEVASTAWNCARRK